MQVAEEVIRDGTLQLVTGRCAAEIVTSYRRSEMEHSIEQELLIVTIARIAHEANKAYCESLGDFSQQPWDYVPQWQIESAINGVKFHLQNPDATPEDTHNNWMEEKIDNGWKYGVVKDKYEKTHPCLVPYEYLPDKQRIKDILFANIVKTFNIKK